MFADQLLPTPYVNIVPPNKVSIYVPSKFSEYSFFKAFGHDPGPVRHILPPPASGHGERLRANKRLLHSVFDTYGIAPDRRILMLAIAMQESETMSPGERDWSKDCTTNDSANYTIFNINLDFIRFVTGSGPPQNLPLVDNSEFINQSSVGCAVDIIDKALSKMNSAIGVLVFHSGGRTAYNAMTATNIDPNNALKGHADAIKTIMAKLEQDRSLQTDNRRVGIAVANH